MVAFRDKRSHCDFCGLIALVVLKKQQKQLILCSVSQQLETRRGDHPLFFASSSNLRLPFISPRSRHCQSCEEEVDIVTFAYATDSHFDDALSDVVLKSIRAPRNVTCRT